MCGVIFKGVKYFICAGFVHRAGIFGSVSECQGLLGGKA